MGHKALWTLAALLVGLVVADRVAGAWWLEDGLYGGRPLPPFGRLADPRLAAWLEKMRAAEAAPHDPPVFGGFHPDYGWCNRPGSSQGFSIDALGARGARPRSPEPAPGVTRVLCLGDSYTYGAEVADGEDWPARLEALCEDTEVLNLGVGGWGTDQALLRFRREGAALHGDVVVIGLHLASIGRNVNRYRQMLLPAASEVRVKPRFVLEGGELRLVPLPFSTSAELLDLLARDELAERLAEHEHWAGDEPLIPGSTLARIAAAERAYARRAHHRLWSEPDGEPFRVTLALLEAIHREALASGARRAVVLVTGFRDDLARLRHEGEPYWQPLLDELATRRVPYIDAASALAPLAAERELFLLTHLNAAGNELLATLVHDWLAASK